MYIRIFLALILSFIVSGCAAPADGSHSKVLKHFKEHPSRVWVESDAHEGNLKSFRVHVDNMDTSDLPHFDAQVAAMKKRCVFGMLSENRREHQYRRRLSQYKSVYEAAYGEVDPNAVNVEVRGTCKPDPRKRP